YLGVWHLPNGSSLSLNDSTANANNGTSGSTASATSGFIDGGASFNGSSSSGIVIPSSSSAWNFANDVTISAWVKSSSNGVGIVALQKSNPLVYLEIGGTTAGGTANKAVAYVRTNSGIVVVANGSVSVNDNSWHYIQVVRHTGARVEIYVDGLLDTS